MSDVSTSESEDAIQILSEGDHLPESDDVLELPIDECGSVKSDANPTFSDAVSAVSSTIASLTTDGDYSGVAISSVKDGVLSQSSSNDTLSSLAQLPSPDHSQTGLSVNVSQTRLTIQLDHLDNGERIASFANMISDVPVESIPADSGMNGSWLQREGDFGDLSDCAEVPLVYLARLLCRQFLLTGYQYGLVSDRRVRVSVKALALSCISYVFELYPKAFLLKLHKSSPESGNENPILSFY